MNETDRQYERHLCEQVLELSRIIYIADSVEPYPTSEQAMIDHNNASMRETRAQIGENIDFIRVSLNYLLFDVESLRRENIKLKESR